jgi:hypothetical protein
MNRLEWILGILLVVLLLAVVVLSFVFWFQPQARTAAGPPNSATVIAARADDIAPTSVFEGQTAKIAFATAQRRAQEWQSDAMLLSATATWPQGARQEELLTGETTWGFTFYAPSTGATATISVVEDKAQLVSQGTHQPASPPLDAGGWKLDSKEAIQSLLDEGGAGFISNEGVTILTMTLSTDNQYQNNRVEWLLALIAPQSGHTLTMRLDANSGEILEFEEAS